VNLLFLEELINQLLPHNQIQLNGKYLFYAQLIVHLAI